LQESRQSFLIEKTKAKNNKAKWKET